MEVDGKAASGDDEESKSDAMKTLTGRCALLNCKLDKTKNDLDFLLKGKPGLRKLMELFPYLSAEDLQNVLKDLGIRCADVASIFDAQALFTVRVLWN